MAEPAGRGVGVDDSTPNTMAGSGKGTSLRHPRLLHWWLSLRGLLGRRPSRHCLDLLEGVDGVAEVAAWSGSIRRDPKHGERHHPDLAVVVVFVDVALVQCQLQVRGTSLRKPCDQSAVGSALHTTHRHGCCDTDTVGNLQLDRFELPRFIVTPLIFVEREMSVTRPGSNWRVRDLILWIRSSGCRTLAACIRRRRSGPARPKCRGPLWRRSCTDVTGPGGGAQRRR